MIRRLLDVTPLLVIKGRMSWLPAMLFLSVVLSGIALSYVAQLNRQSFNQLQSERMRKNALQEEWGQLLLQHSTLTAHGRIENLAREQLNMDVPGKDRIVRIQP